MITDFRTMWEKLMERVLGYGRITQALCYIGPFAALSGLLLILCIVFSLKKKKGAAIAFGIFSVFCALAWKLSWIDYYRFSSASTWLPVLAVAAVAGLMMFRGEARGRRDGMDDLHAELEKLRREKNKLRQEVERLKASGAGQEEPDRTPPVPVQIPVQAPPQVPAAAPEAPVPTDEAPLRQTVSVQETRSPQDPAAETPVPDASKADGGKPGQIKEENDIGLLGKKEAGKENAQAPAFDPGSGVLFKAATMKEWTLYRDSIQLGREKFLFSELSKVVNAEIPTNRLLQGVINIFPKSGGFKLLGYAFSQKDAAAQAVEYISRKIEDSLTPEESAARRELEAFQAGRERRMRCNVCGSIFCYSYQDLLRNQELAKQAKNAAIRGALSTIATSQILGAQEQAEADRKLAQIRDYTHCPNCNSTDLKQLSDDEYREALAAKNAPAPAAAPSAADEIKKFKELLDLGIITQEEFDAKKKQLLGL